MTDRLYYHDSFLYDFDANITEVLETPRPAVILDRTAFYPTSGGQVFDTGTIHVGADALIRPAREASVSSPSENETLRVTEVADTEDGKVIHYLEAPAGQFHKNVLKPGIRIHGFIDPARRRDHMQQHSGQHVLSAAFIRRFNMPTVSFHMADDYCSIDLDTPSLTKENIEAAERLANEIILENRIVDIRFVTPAEAANLGLRKLPPAERDQLRLIDIHDFDLTACGGTHVNQTGQIGCILLRKIERVRQGYRVEFVAGQRAVATARRDFTVLTETAGFFSSHIYDVPQQARKSLDEIRSLRKQLEQSQEQLAAVEATALLAETPESNGRKLIVRSFADRDLSFIKLLAQKLTRQSPAAIALLATTAPQPSLIFARASAQTHDMGALMKEIVTKFGGRGGGGTDLAQGGLPRADALDAVLTEASRKISA